MPEQLTKHPEVTLDVLRSAGLVCGERAAPPTILTKCPVDRFCKAPGGELCVYGLRAAASMGQITKADWEGLATIVPLFAAAPEPAPASHDGPALQAAIAGAGTGLLLGVAVGLAIAAWQRRRRQQRRARRSG
jgi:hypothetical protein